jgi:SAM-dependent methyltransferase
MEREVTGRAALRTAVTSRLRLLAPTRRLRFAFAQAALERFAAGRPLRLLDAGCSEALFAERVGGRNPGWTIDALDVDPDVVAQGRAAIATAGLTNVDVRVGDLLEPLGDGVYDAIAALECLTLVPDVSLALARMSAALRPGGLFVAVVPEKHWRPIFRGSDPTWLGELRHGFTPDELRAMVAEAGLEVVSLRPISRVTARAGRELAQAVERRGMKARAAAAPILAVLYGLERIGLTWGAPGAYFVEAKR